MTVHECGLLACQETARIKLGLQGTFAVAAIVKNARRSSGLRFAIPPYANPPRLVGV